MHNPYQAPAASLETFEQLDAPVFFPVSVTKFVVLSICTLGLYEVYWLYKNWSLVKSRENSNIMPVMRAVFGLFFCHSLLRKINDQAGASGVSPIAAGGLATGWIILNILWRAPEPYSLISMFAFLFLIPAQQAINAINSKLAPGHDNNSKFSGWNIAAVIIGGTIFVLSIVGTFVPDEMLE
jgi:hypothetical protein